MYLSYIKGNGRCGHFATSFVFLNFFIFPTVKLRYITRGDFIIPGATSSYTGAISCCRGRMIQPPMGDCPVLFSPGGGHCPGHVLPPETLYRYRFSGGLVLGGPTYHASTCVLMLQSALAYIARSARVHLYQSIKITGIGLRVCVA